METKNEKTENKSVQGNITFIGEEKGTEKKYVDVGIGVSKIGEEKKFENVRVWSGTKGDDGFSAAKVGDFIKVEGYYKTLPKLENQAEKTIFNVTEIKEFKANEKLKVTGILGADPELKSVGKVGESKKNVITLSIAINTNGETEWKRIQLWEEKTNLANDLKKGDTITVEGKEGKEYTYKKGDDLLVAKDIIADVVEKHKKLSKEEVNANLLSNAQKGDYKAVSEDLRKGADPKLVTEEHLKDLTPKQSDAIKNTIRAHNDFVEKQAEKKNSGMKV